jgi:adhesin/invasin
MRRLYALPIGLLLAGLTAGCTGDVVLPEDSEAANLEIVDGDEQIGQVGATLGEQLLVRVTDARHRPVPNHDVSFSIESGGGTVEPATLKTNPTGHAAATWTLGPTAGKQMLRVQTLRGGTSTNLEVTFEATASAGTGRILVGVTGDDQNGPVNSALADSLVVKATDALGNPVANVEVSWTVSGGGSISPASVRTDEAGLAAAERVLGPTAGPQSAQATVPDYTGSPVTFTHTAGAANPTVLVLVDGDDQIGPGGFELAESLVVRLQDDNGNGIGGRSISWIPLSGSGSVNPANSTTDPNGLAATRWTLPVAAGSYAVSAVFSGLPPVQFSATATPDAPTTIELLSGDNQTAAVASALPNPLVVRVTDANDNPVANVGVTWTAVNGGSVSDATTATNASGLAQVTRTLGLLPGTYTTTAEVEGLSGSPVTFTSTATVGPPAQLAFLIQPGSPTASGAAFNPAPQLQVQDAQGNPVGQAGGGDGLSVTAHITSGQVGASLENEGPRSTNGNGRVTFTNLRITGPPDDDYVITFTSPTLAPVSSALLTVGAGTAARIVIQQQPGGSVVNGQVISPAPVVQVEDGAGNPVSGNRNIVVTIGSGAGALSGTTTVNTGGGATATFSNLVITGATGPRTLLFSSSGLISAESSEIDVTTGPPASMAIQAGNSQSAPVGTAVPVPPAVVVRDQSGNPVAGVSVDFDVTAGGGSVTPGTVTTGSNGIAAVTSWTLGPAAGTNTLVASVPSAPALGTETFTATGTSVNQPPTAQADAYSVDEDATLTVDDLNDVLSNDDDPDGNDDDLTAVLVTGPSNAQSFQLNSDGSFTYTPNPDFNGSDSFTYRASDGEDESNEVTVTITVNPIDDSPTFQIGGNVTSSALAEIATGHTEPGWLTAIDPGPPDESQTVTFEVTTDNDGAFFVTPQVDPSTGNLTYHAQLTALTVSVNANVIATDGDGTTSDPQPFAITIEP